MSTHIDRMIDQAIMAGLLEPSQRGWALRMVVEFDRFGGHGCETFRAWLATIKQMHIEKIIRQQCDTGQALPLKRPSKNHNQ